MTNEIVETIERYIGNRFYEAHPFSSGSAGMEAFSKLYHITRKQYPEFILNNILNEIDELLKEKSITSCFSCHMKLLIFAMCICEDKLPEHGRVYTSKILSLNMQKRRSNERDYCLEVRRSIYTYRERKSSISF